MGHRASRASDSSLESSRARLSTILVKTGEKLYCAEQTSPGIGSCHALDLAGGLRWRCAKIRRRNQTQTEWKIILSRSAQASNCLTRSLSRGPRAGLAPGNQFADSQVAPVIRLRKEPSKIRLQVLQTILVLTSHVVY